MSSVEHIGAYGVCIDAGQILLSRYAPPDGRWVLPGGSVEEGEGLEAAVVREVFEETGYRVTAGELLGVTTSTWTTADGVEIHSTRHIFSVGVVGGELAHEVDGSSDMAAWFRVDAVGTLPHTQIVDQALALLNSHETDA